MTKRFLQWLDRKWQPVEPSGLREAYQVTFSTLYGQQVLQHLIDQSYATICESNHPIDLAAHNARRSVVHDILINIDVASQPDKYTTPQEIPHDHRDPRSPSQHRASVNGSGVIDF